ncbi:hypothetical protein [Microbacterium rhizosphaerae]|uniref:DUF2029 domain-containing protein n=1 Tax=Microbacterium rhizosphaerae TaxID=1678237 RepID=A0ABZ0ST34_9MICO|nr:hypothetical protein [Microbacterium rhizosphaerae]WPR90827.1 hypothetical protein SM116_05910 [Microbacterium rhizosphaerae]
MLGWVPRAAPWTHIDPRMLDFGASVASQLVWVPAAAALLWALGFRRRVVLASLFFTAAVPVMFVNTVYTWPKLLAAGMMVAALAVLVAAIRGRIPVSTGSVLGAALSVLGVLAHGGGAFVLPAVGVLWLVLIIRSPRRWRAVSAALGVAVVLYLPWALFQRLAYPPGDRLLKWHLAGVIPIDSRSFPEALVDSYSKLGWGAWLEGREANLSRAFDPGVLADLDFWVPAARSARQTLEFSATPPALAVGALILCAFLIAAVVGILRRRFDAELRWPVMIVLSMVGCILIWAIVMFLPGAAIVHQGSHTWIVVLLCVPFAWLASRSRVIATAAAVVQVAWAVVLYNSAPLSPASRLDRWALLLLVISAVLAVGAMMFRVRRPLMSQQPPVATT